MGLKGREAAATAAEPPESPVFAKQKCARMIRVFIWNRLKDLMFLGSWQRDTKKKFFVNQATKT
jgi:hypothetical protein